MTTALLLVLLGVVQGVAADVAILRERRLTGLLYTLSSLVALVGGIVLLILEWL